MAILSVTELFDQRSGSINLMYERTYTRVFEVTTDDPRVGIVAVRTAPGIPQTGAFYTNGVLPSDPYYEYDHGAFVNSIKPDPDGTATAWKVVVEYGPYNAAEFSADPTQWKIRVQFGGERTDKVVEFDRDGNPIRNSSRDRFGDPVVIDDHVSTMTITRNELVSAYDPALASTFSDTINASTWGPFGLGLCKMGIISTSEEKWAAEAQVWYYTVTYPIFIGRKKWKKELLDQGYNALNSSGIATPIMRAGQPISEPVALDGSGHELPVSGTPVTLPYEVYDETDWSLLNLDLSVRLGV